MQQTEELEAHKIGDLQGVLQGVQEEHKESSPDQHTETYL